MHAGAKEIEAAFATEGVIKGQHDDAIGNEGVDQKGGDGHGERIE